MIEVPESGHDCIVDRLDFRLDGCNPGFAPGTACRFRSASGVGSFCIRSIRLGTGVPVQHEHRLAPGRGAAGEGAVGAVSARVPVEHQDVLSVVLRADLIDVEERHRRVGHRFAHHAVALVVLLPRPRRGGQVDDETGAGAMPSPEGIERLEAIAVVLMPDVLAELHSEADDAVAGRDLVGDHPRRNVRIGLAGNLAQRVEVPVVVEEPVVRVQCLRMDAVRKGRGQTLALDEPPVMADPRRVELAHATVLADRLSIDGDVAEHDDDSAACVADRLAPALVVLDQRVDLPGIAQDIARNAHLRERDDRRLGVPRPVDEPEHRIDVEIRPPRPHFHLREGDGGTFVGHFSARSQRGRARAALPVRSPGRHACLDNPPRAPRSRRPRRRGAVSGER